MGNMTGVWPSGGLFVISADILSKGLWVYTIFGLTNPDMPANSKMTDLKTEKDNKGRPSKYTGTLQHKESTKTSSGTAGYDYEMLLIAKENAEWPLWFMQWTVNAGIIHDAGILERVEKYNGLTVEQIQVGENESVDVLIGYCSQHPHWFDLWVFLLDKLDRCRNACTHEHACHATTYRVTAVRLKS